MPSQGGSEKVISFMQKPNGPTREMCMGRVYLRVGECSRMVCGCVQACIRVTARVCLRVSVSAHEPAASVCACMCSSLWDPGSAPAPQSPPAACTTTPNHGPAPLDGPHFGGTVWGDPAADTVQTAPCRPTQAPEVPWEAPRRYGTAVSGMASVRGHCRPGVQQPSHLQWLQRRGDPEVCRPGVGLPTGG